MARLVDQMREALAVFAACGAAPALIGGLALAAHNAVRATQDIDFLADSSDADKIHSALLKIGYRCIQRSEDAANYLRGDEGLDLLYAHRPVARRLLGEAEVRETPIGQLRVLSAEGLIGFKLQGHTKMADPAQSMQDRPFAASGGSAYVRPGDSDPVEAWMELMELIEILCPRWPSRSAAIGNRYLL